MLSTAGRVTVIKTLILQKITHLLISLPNPPGKHIKEIKTIFIITYGIQIIKSSQKAILFRDMKGRVTNDMP